MFGTRWGLAVEVLQLFFIGFGATHVRVVRRYSLAAKEFVAFDSVLHHWIWNCKIGAAKRHLKPCQSFVGGGARHNVPIQPVDVLRPSKLATGKICVPSRRIATGQVGARILVMHVRLWVCAVGIGECEAGEGLIGGALHTVPVEIRIDLANRVVAGCGEN